MDELPLSVGARHDVEYVGANITLAHLEAALLVGTGSGPNMNEYTFRREDGREIVLHPARILRAELAAGE